MHSVNELQTITAPHMERFAHVVFPIQSHYLEIPDSHRLAYDLRTEANIRHRYMVENAKREFTGVPGTHFPSTREFMLGLDGFPFGIPGQVACRFKQLNDDYHSRNYPTTRAEAIRKNDPEVLEIEGIPEATIIDIGPVLDALRTRIVAVVAVRLWDERFIWRIENESGGKITLAPQLVDPRPNRDRFTIQKRKEKESPDGEAS